MNKTILESKQYNFAVEGQTEKLYFEHLQKLINSDPNAKSHVKFNIKVSKHPTKYAKEIKGINKVTLYYIFDRESEEPIDTKNFVDALKQMAKFQKKYKRVTFKIGYSNLTFELWILLHKKLILNKRKHRKDYLKDINDMFGRNFDNLDKFKSEKIFKQILDEITIADVRFAVSNARKIEKNLLNAGTVKQKIGHFAYFDNNPSTSLHEIIGLILDDVY